MKRAENLMFQEDRMKKMDKREDKEMRKMMERAAAAAAQGAKGSSASVGQAPPSSQPVVATEKISLSLAPMKKPLSFSLMGKKK